MGRFRTARRSTGHQEGSCGLICSNVSPDYVGGIERAAADLHELGERAARRSLRVAFEALAWGRHINDYRDAWEAVRRANHPAVGLVLDTFHILARTFHILARKTDLNAIRSIPRDRIFLVQRIAGNEPDTERALSKGRLHVSELRSNWGAAETQLG